MGFPLGPVRYRIRERRRTSDKTSRTCDKHTVYDSEEVWEKIKNKHKNKSASRPLPPKDELVETEGEEKETKQVLSEADAAAGSSMAIQRKEEEESKPSSSSKSKRSRGISDDEEEDDDKNNPSNHPNNSHLVGNRNVKN